MAYGQNTPSGDSFKRFFMPFVNDAFTWAYGHFAIELPPSIKLIRGRFQISNTMQDHKIVSNGHDEIRGLLMKPLTVMIYLILTLIIE